MAKWGDSYDNVSAQRAQALVAQLDAQLYGRHMPHEPRYRPYAAMRHHHSRAETRSWDRQQAYAEAPPPGREHLHHGRHRQQLGGTAAPQDMPQTGYSNSHGNAHVDMASLRQHYEHTAAATGGCLGGVETALAATGINLDRSLMPLRRGSDGELTHFAKDAGPALQKAGFRPIGRVPLDEVPPGCAVVFGATEGHPAGHVQLAFADSEHGARSWVSDNVQGYSNPYGHNNYEVYQPSSVAFNDAAPTRQYADAGHTRHHHANHHQYAEGHHQHRHIASHSGRHFALGMNGPTPPV